MSIDTPEAPLIEVHPDPAALATSVAGELLNRIADAQAAGHVPHIGLTGGTIAEAIHREVARLAPASGVDWGAVHFWFGDERFVASDSPDRNAGQARAAFLDEVGATRVHEVPASDQVADAEAAAAAYGDEMRAEGAGHFDVLMLGVGPDGHIASLFPGHPGLEATDAIAVAVHDSPKPPPDRVTLTFDALGHARSVWFLVSGSGKADAVSRALAVEGSRDGTSVAETPARGVVGHDETVWFLDHDAASLL
ncbi:6-phosphogluconolactonase [Nocardioides sp. GY 10113]|uniref:6-phosphogluconolactonase n=1 Tax=Nocardioides sp. GY 10113 TaxID=2569761 RepID=UPI0010A8D3B5|nr:6-phosphogluconolactonase [Nocardioides sp. GY 10113]TIC87818.1 6-phosphogluconolactonase [Nocardioides sp. GY 10113]